MNLIRLGDVVGDDRNQLLLLDRVNNLVQSGQARLLDPHLLRASDCPGSLALPRLRRLAHRVQALQNVHGVILSTQFLDCINGRRARTLDIDGLRDIATRLVESLCSLGNLRRATRNGRDGGKSTRDATRVVDGILLHRRQGWGWCRPALQNHPTATQLIQVVSPAPGSPAISTSESAAVSSSQNCPTTPNLIEVISTSRTAAVATAQDCPPAPKLIEVISTAVATAQDCPTAPNIIEVVYIPCTPVASLVRLALEALLLLSERPSDVLVRDPPEVRSQVLQLSLVAGVADVVDDERGGVASATEVARQKAQELANLPGTLGPRLVLEIAESLIEELPDCLVDPLSVRGILAPGVQEFLEAELRVIARGHGRRDGARRS